MMVVRKVPELYGALHAFTSFSVSGFYDSRQETQTPWLTWVFALLQYSVRRLMYRFHRLGRGEVVPGAREP